MKVRDIPTLDEMPEKIRPFLHEPDGWSSPTNRIVSHYVCELWKFTDMTESEILIAINDMFSAIYEISPKLG